MDRARSRCRAGINPFAFKAHLLTSIICKHRLNRRRFAGGFKPLFPVAASTEAISENPQIKGGNFGGGGMQINEREETKDKHLRHLQMRLQRRTRPSRGCDHDHDPGGGLGQSAKERSNQQTRTLTKRLIHQVSGICF